MIASLNCPSKATLGSSGRRVAAQKRCAPRPLPLLPPAAAAPEAASGGGAAAAEAAAVAAEPTVALTFVESGGKDGGGATRREVECPSGEQLRAVMIDSKVDLYTTWGKIWSCGGVGQCGTCIVKVEEGADILSERTATEDRKLKGRPADWRLACQTIVGDGERGGRVTIVTKPQG